MTEFQEVEIVSFFFPFSFEFYFLYIGDNVNFKYGGGERHLHEPNEFKQKFSKSYNMHDRVLESFESFISFIFIF